MVSSSFVDNACVSKINSPLNFVIWLLISYTVFASLFGTNSNDFFVQFVVSLKTHHHSPSGILSLPIISTPLFSNSAIFSLDKTFKFFFPISILSSFSNLKVLSFMLLYLAISAVVVILLVIGFARNQAHFNNPINHTLCTKFVINHTLEIDCSRAAEACARASSNFHVSTSVTTQLLKGE